MGKQRLLVILAHPDDESFPLGGTLAKYAAQGVQITLVCATRGEKGIPGLSLNETARIREAELRAAAEKLGIAEVRFLNLVDGEVAQVDENYIVSMLTNAMRRIRPAVVITFGPDGISGHTDHVTISRLATLAYDRAVHAGFLPLISRLYYIAPSEATQQGCGVMPGQEIAGGPVALIDVGAYLVTKVTAAQQHVSQNPPFTGLPEEEAEHMPCHEYFTLARPSSEYLSKNMDDLFSIFA